MFWNYYPFEELESLRQRLDDIFENTAKVRGETFPSVNIYESDDDIEFLAELPGIEKNDINLEICGGTLKISGKRSNKAKEGNQILRLERIEGDFERTFNLPVKIQENKVYAKMENGMLSVTIPKAEESKPKAINVDVK